MRAMRRFRLLLLAAPLLALGVQPAAAGAACGVGAARAEFETPEVQIYARTGDLVACHRATGRAWFVGTRVSDGMGTDAFSSVNAVLGRRWVWASQFESFAESADVREDTLIDLRTAKKVVVRVEDEDTDVQAVALPGALVLTGNGVTARFTDGRRQVLSTDPTASGLAVTGARVYWRAKGVAQTAVLQLPAADPARRRPLVRTIGRCKPRPNARLVLRADTLVLSRAGGGTWACRRGKTRRLVQGQASEITALSDRLVAYTRPGVARVVDVATGRYRELPSTGGRIAATPFAFAAASSSGVLSWTTGRAASALLGTGAATEVAIGDDVRETVAYWLDGTGVARSAVVPR